MFFLACQHPWEWGLSKEGQGMWDSHLKKNVPGREVGIWWAYWGSEAVGVSRPRGGEGMVREGRRQADPADSLLSELRIHSRALSKEVADGNWCGHPGDVITLVMWSEWSFWQCWKQKLKCWGRGRETPGGFRCQPGARCDGGSGWGVVVKQTNGWILNMFWRSNRIFCKLNVGE